MSLSWHQRKSRLASLLKSQGDEDADAIALDRLMHGQSVIGKTSKTTEIDALRFKDNDLDVVGTLEYGQFGVIHVVTCRLNNCVYVRKSIDKKFVLRAREQCSPLFERDILLQALKTDTPWAPHLLCAFQTKTKLNFVMDYAEGGNLWDVLESSPRDGRVQESDLRWWVPQIVSAIHWCHSQGFAHRDIKPHNFVLTPDAHILLIDFGSAAPLLPPNADGSQLIPKKYCLVPCGTCDYISPEILQAHEEALVALEMDDEDDIINVRRQNESEGYGAETDWWSLGAMLYELAYGVAPFFADDIRQTYTKIMNHERSLRFDQKVLISHEYQHFLRRLLTHSKQRLGRRNVMEITDHPFFEGVDWTTLPSQTAPVNLHVPHFAYSEKPITTTTEAFPGAHEDDTETFSQGFAFSAFFQPSSSIAIPPSGSPALSSGSSILRPSAGSRSGYFQTPTSLSFRDSSSMYASSFIGFSWGPAVDAFPEEVVSTPEQDQIRHAPDSLSPMGDRQYLDHLHATPRPILRTPLRSSQFQTPAPTNHTYHALSVPRNIQTWGPGNPAPFFTPKPLQSYTTPIKPYALSPYAYATLPRTGTIRRTTARRNVSDREAMKQLVDCVGMSARKKVLESGRKPKIIGAFGNGLEGLTSKGSATAATTGISGALKKQSSYGGTLKKELRFDRFTTPILGPDYSTTSSKHSGRSQPPIPNPNFGGDTDDSSKSRSRDSEIYFSSRYAASDIITDSESEDGVGGPPSPSPSPRPGSAMSMMSMTTMTMSRRSATPTISGYPSGSGRLRSGSGSLFVTADRSLTATMTTSSGLLSIPSAGLGNLDFKIEQPPASKQITATSKPLSTVLSTNTTSMNNINIVQSSHGVKTLLKNPPLAARVSKVEGKKQIVNSYTSETRTRSLNWLEDLEARHSAIIKDIESLEERFSAVSGLVAKNH